MPEKFCSISSRHAPNSGRMSPFCIRQARHILSICRGAVKYWVISIFYGRLGVAQTEKQNHRTSVVPLWFSSNFDVRRNVHPKQHHHFRKQKMANYERNKTNRPTFNFCLCHLYELEKDAPCILCSFTSRRWTFLSSLLN